MNLRTKEIFVSRGRHIQKRTDEEQKISNKKQSRTLVASKTWKSTGHFTSTFAHFFSSTNTVTNTIIFNSSASSPFQPSSLTMATTSTSPSHPVNHHPSQHRDQKPPTPRPIIDDKVFSKILIMYILHPRPFFLLPPPPSVSLSEINCGEVQNAKNIVNTQEYFC